MAKTVLLGKDKEKQLKEQRKLAKQKNKKQRQPLGRSIKNIFSELKKVTWPTKKEWFSNAVVVLIVIVAMGIVYGLIDLGLSELFRMLISAA